MTGKYKTLDARIVAAIGARRKRTRRRIGQDKFVHREMLRVVTWDDHFHNESYARFWRLLSRRLTTLRAAGLIRCNVFDRWILATK